MPFPNPSQVPLRVYATRGLDVATRTDLLASMQAAALTITRQTAKTVVAFLTAVDKGMTEMQPALLAAHGRIAEQAQAAIVDAYTEGLKHTPTYRTDPIHERNRRYAGGILLSVLESSDFVKYDEHGVYIGNVRDLDARARQWARLNYGAGGAAGAGAQSYTVRWSDLDLFVLEEPGSARPGFRLPPGRWFDDEFYPLTEITASMRRGDSRRSYHPTVMRRLSWRNTRGIEGIHYLAAGLKSVAENIGDEYTRAFKELWAEATEETKAAIGGDIGLSRPGNARSTIESTHL